MRFRWPWTVTQVRRKLRALLRQEPFDMVIFYGSWSHSLFAPIARAAGLPVVFWARDAVAGRHWLERWAKRTPPDLVLANSRYTEGTVRRLFLGVPSEVVTPTIAPSQVADAGHVRDEVRAQLGRLPRRS